MINSYQHIILPFTTKEQVETAAIFVAKLTERGEGYDAKVVNKTDHDVLVIDMNGAR